MASSNGKITIWNMALGFIGTRTVASEEEKVLEAVQCKLYWDSARRQALRDFPWNFAQRRARLGQIVLPEGYEEQYSFAYALPGDMLQALRLYPQGKDYEHLGDKESGRFILVYNAVNNAQVLLCNADKAVLAYTADIEDVSLFDDLFIIMLARKLAAMIAVSLLKNNASRVSELEELYLRSIPRAIQADANEGRTKEKTDTWIQARGGYYAEQ